MANNASLYAINAELQDLVNRLDTMLLADDGRFIDTETGEILEPDFLENLKLAREEKVKNCLYQVKNYEIEEAQADAKIAYLKAALESAKAEKEAVTNRKERFKTYVGLCLDNKKWTDKDKTISCSFRSVKSAEVTNEAVIPMQYRKVTAVFSGDNEKVLQALLDTGVENIKYEPKKAEALKALKAGEKIKGFSLKEGYSMTVK